MKSYIVYLLKILIIFYDNILCSRGFLIEFKFIYVHISILNAMLFNSCFYITDYKKIINTLIYR